ncbi:alpha/beta fold hydrolase [Actinoplanes sp. NBRC 101535]|uniref:dienelactone hydrolase family protein n=1 Tax=Actinoplanes sp. NBRC 101535 TaxID=3032196 RepID=UPI0024A422FB|nr:alpha/beta fold hydrolase [Actinoplanes sp. NBRC 101535]GLX99688.1 hydrolase [Actinoplanes sp. NBRC 101535]
MKRRVFVTLPAAALAATPIAAAGTPAPATAAGNAAAKEATASPEIVAGNMPAFAGRLKDELTFPLAWTDPRNRPGRDTWGRGFRAWKRQARAKVEELLWQPADDTPFDVEIVDEQQADGYRRRTLLFSVTRHSRVRASMLVPDGPGPFPAALLLHDHGAKFDIGKEKLVAPWSDPVRLASAQAWSQRYFSGRFPGDELARRGYAVLAVDALGWGDRGDLAYDGQQALASNFFNLGGSLAGLTAREDVRAAAMLAGLPEVDRRRVAAVGFSMGGYRAWQVAALSDAIAATVSICWMTGLKEMMVPGNNTLRGQSAFFMLHPGLPRFLDIPDVASIAAPRPMLVFNGGADTLFTAEGVRVAYTKMRAVWESQRAGDHLVTRVWPELGHAFPAEMQEAAFAWLDGHLTPTQ